MSDKVFSNADFFVEEGVNDFQDGISFEECPYPEGTDGENGWKRGWRIGEGMEKDLLP